MNEQMESPGEIGDAIQKIRCLYDSTNVKAGNGAYKQYHRRKNGCPVLWRVEFMSSDAVFGPVCIGFFPYTSS
jgi:hypothetical protein